MEKKMTKTEILATFIVQNWHYCPLTEDVSVKECEGWTGGLNAFAQAKCVKCICKHTDSVILNTDN